MSENYKAVSKPPISALREIQGGDLKGKTDINPQWRYEVMDQVYGQCGIGVEVNLHPMGGITVRSCLACQLGSQITQPMVERKVVAEQFLQTIQVWIDQDSPSDGKDSIALRGARKIFIVCRISSAQINV